MPSLSEGHASRLTICWGSLDQPTATHLDPSLIQKAMRRAALICHPPAGAGPGHPHDPGAHDRYPCPQSRPPRCAQPCGPHREVIEACRKADWIDASKGMLRKGLSRSKIQRVEAAFPNLGFRETLLRLAKDYGGSTLVGAVKVTLGIVKL